MDRRHKLPLQIIPGVRRTAERYPLIERLALLWRRFTPLEEQLLAAVRRAVAGPLQATFDAQVAGVNLVQRGAPGWTEIIFYRMRRGRVDWSDLPSFPRQDEFALAEITFSVGGRRFRSKLTCLSGHIVDFGTHPGPKSVAFAAWDSGAEAQLLSDPTRPGQAPNRVPAEWLGLRARHPSADGGPWSLHNEATAYSITLHAGEFLVLAEREGDDFLLFRVHPPGGYWIQEGHDSTPAKLNQSIETWLRGRLTTV
jgi:hypothetical protein